MSERATSKILFFLLALSILSTAAVTAQFWGATTIKALWLHASVIVALPIYIALLLEHPRLRPDWRNPLNLAVVAFALVNIIAALLGVNWTRSFWGSYERMTSVFHLLHLTLLYFYLLTIAAAEPRWMTILTNLLIGIAGLSGIYGICEVVLGLNSRASDLSLLNDHRVSSIHGNPIFFASFLILPMALTLFCWLRSSIRWHKTAYELLFAFEVIALIFTGTRGALLGLAVGALLAGGLLVWKETGLAYRFKTLLWLSVAALAVAVPIIAFPRSLPALVFHHVAQANDASAKARLIVWRIAWQAFIQKPLLGVGPENYYAAFYKNFDRELYKYADYFVRFDKPHNHLLELLATTGLAGFLTYCAILALAVFGLWKGYKSGILAWREFAVLVGGIAAYEVQNSFAFDAQAALVAFYFCLAFAGIQWMRSLPTRSAASKGVHVPAMLFWVVVASTAYGAYVTYGNAADVVRQISNAKASSDTAMSLALFRGVSQEPYLWDRSALAYSYVDRLTDADQSVDAAQLNSGLDNAIPVLQRAITEAPDDPLLSLKLASLYSQKHALDGSAPDPNWGLAIHHAMDFAPNWIEPLNYLAEYEAACKHYDQATRLANQAVDLLPENPEVRWSQASVYRLLDQEDVAAETAWQALQIGYRIRSAKEGIWLSDYYSERRNYDRVVEVYRMAIKARPNDIGLYRKLVDTYVDLGAKQKAVAIAIQASKVDPSNQEWRAFVQRLQ